MRTAIRLICAMALVGAGLSLPSAPVRAAAQATQPTKAAAWAGGPGYRVLVFTKTAGERRSSIKAGVAAIRDIGRRHGFTVEATDDARWFTDRLLKRFRAVVFLNTTGDVLNDGQQAAFERYFTDGGGFLGIRSAAETEPDWDFYQQVLGTKAAGTSTVQRATVKVADRVHPAGAGLPEYWQPADAFYNFAGNVRGVSHVLATVDENTFSGGTMGPDHPIIWCKDYRGGRSFYSGLGETAATFQ